MVGDRLSELSQSLSTLIAQIESEADARGMRELMAPIAWLREADGWLAYELSRVQTPGKRDDVPFTYIPVELRK